MLSTSWDHFGDYVIQCLKVLRDVPGRSRCSMLTGRGSEKLMVF